MLGFVYGALPSLSATPPLATSIAIMLGFVYGAGFRQEFALEDEKFEFHAFASPREALPCV
jgi:hypothetical protein